MNRPFLSAVPQSTDSKLKKNAWLRNDNRRSIKQPSVELRLCIIFFSNKQTQKLELEERREPFGFDDAGVKAAPRSKTPPSLI